MTESGPQAENKEKLKKRILIADDDVGNLQSMIWYLEDDYEVETAGNAEELLKKLNSGEKFDLVITDNNMGPGIKGIEALKAIHQDKKFNTLPVILYSAIVTEDMKRAVAELGYDCFEKGRDSIEVVSKTIEKHLSNSK